MAHKWPSRVRETTTQQGTGAYVLAGAVTSYRAFSEALEEGDTCDVSVVGGADFEIGRYTMTSGALARTTILVSSNGGGAVNWSAGTKDIFAGYIGFTDQDETGVADLGLLLGGLVGVSGTPTAGQYARWTGAAQLEGRSTSQALSDIGGMPAAYLDTDVTLAANSDVKVASQKAVKTYVDAIALGLGKRQRVRAATTGPITIATALNNGDTLDGVTLATGDLVLVKDQSSAAQNGIYAVGVSPARAPEFDTWDEYPGSLYVVAEGTTNGDTLWICTANAGGTLDTTAITFSRLVIAGELLAANNLNDVADAATSRSNLSAARKGGWETTREVTSASGTLAATDAGGLIKMNRGSAQTLNIPANASVAIPVDDAISAQQIGAGVLTIDAPTGVTLNGVDGGSAAITRRYGAVTLTKIATDAWVMSGAHQVVS